MGYMHPRGFLSGVASGFRRDYLEAIREEEKLFWIRYAVSSRSAEAKLSVDGLMFPNFPQLCIVSPAIQT